MTFAQLRSDLRADRARAFQLIGFRRGVLGSLFVFFMPSMMALRLYRWSHWFYCTRLRFLAWPVWAFNSYLTGADIQPGTKIGAGCYIGHPVGCALGGKIGANAVLFGAVVIGGGRGRGDVGAGDGLPVVGDNLVMGHAAHILGPIVVGDNVTVGAMSLVIHDVPAGSVVVGIPARVIKSRSETIDYDAIARESLEDRGGGAKR